MTGRAGFEGAPPDPTPGQAIIAAALWTALVITLIVILIGAW